MSSTYRPTVMRRRRRGWPSAKFGEKVVACADASSVGLWQSSYSPPLPSGDSAAPCDRCRRQCGDLARGTIAGATQSRGGGSASTSGLRRSSDPVLTPRPAPQATPRPRPGPRGRPRGQPLPLSVDCGSPNPPPLPRPRPGFGNSTSAPSTGTTVSVHSSSASGGQFKSNVGAVSLTSKLLPMCRGFVPPLPRPAQSRFIAATPPSTSTVAASPPITGCVTENCPPLQRRGALLLQFRRAWCAAANAFPELGTERCLGLGVHRCFLRYAPFHARDLRCPPACPHFCWATTSSG